MSKVFIRNDTDGFSSRGLMVIFEHEIARETRTLRVADAEAAVQASREANVPETDVVFAEEDHSDGALTRKQFASLQEAMSHYSMGSDRIPG